MIPVFDASGAALSTTVTEFVVVLIQAVALRSMLTRNRKGLHLLRYVFCGLFDGLICALIGSAGAAMPAIVRLVVTFILFDIAFLSSLFVAKDEFVLSFLQIAKDRVGRE